MHGAVKTELVRVIIITTIKRTGIGDAAYATSHAAAEACTQRLAAGRVDGYQVTGSACSSKRPSTGRTCCVSCESSDEAASLHVQ